MHSKMLHFLLGVLVLAFSDASVIKMIQDLDTTTAPKVQVVVYTQSISPPCLNWLQAYLIPTYDILGAIMNLTVLPFGNAHEHKSGGKYTFTCQDGVQECYGNIVETCVLHFYPNLTNNLNFMNCFESDLQSQDPPVWTNSLRECAKPFDIDEGKIAYCVKGDEGMKLEHAVATKTGDHTYVPWANIDGKHEWDIEFSLFNKICEAYTGPKPDYCKTLLPKFIHLSTGKEIDLKDNGKDGA